MTQHMTEAALPGFRVDIVFNHQTEDGKTEIEILEVIPFGVVPPGDIKDMAYDWLHTGGGYDLCCRIAEVKS